MVEIVDELFMPEAVHELLAVDEEQEVVLVLATARLFTADGIQVVMVVLLLLLVSIPSFSSRVFLETYETS